MKFRGKNIKNLKIVRFCKETYEKAKRFIQTTFEHTDPGRIIIAIIVASSIVMGLVRTYLPMLPWVVCGLLGFILVVVIGEVLRLLARLVIGVRQRKRIYGFLQFFSILFCTFVVVQPENILSDVIFSLVMGAVLSLFGRSCFAIIKNKKRTVLGISCLSGTFVILVIVAVFLEKEGFSHSYIEEYLNMASGALAAQNTETLTPLKQGSYEVASFSYGMDGNADVTSSNVDLSPFMERGFPAKTGQKWYFGYEITDVPLTGKVWYPMNETNCPVLFIIHGNHTYVTDSYLGYEYLAKYLASYGYVVVSVDENSCNILSSENDGRAVLLLENMKYLFAMNQDKESPYYQIMDEEKVALAGHSRGGEAVSEAYLFNGYDSYPEDGMVPFDYHFNISSIIAIAPTVDQYQPAEHEVALEDVNYLLVHGSNDHDVTTTMGEKQYSNVTFRGDGEYLKSMLYISGANHGQFNTLWGKYDSGYQMKYFLNVANLIDVTSQQDILKRFVKTFLDVTLKEDKTEEQLLYNVAAYQEDLPKTVYQQTCQSSDFICLSDFEEDSDLNSATMEGARIQGEQFKEWKEAKRIFGNDQAGENYVLEAEWEDTKEAKLIFTMPQTDLTQKTIMFDLADNNEDDIAVKDLVLLDGTVTLTDDSGQSVSTRISDYTVVYPTHLLQLRKLDFIFDEYEHKHQFQTVSIPSEAFTKDGAVIDLSQIVSLSITFDYSENGKIQLDNVGFE